MKFGFIAHPTSIGLLNQVKLLDMADNMITEQTDGYSANSWKRRNLVPFADFSCITSANGQQCEGMLQFIPLTAEQMLSRPHDIAERVLRGVRFFHEQGAELVGLGGFTAIVGNRGIQTLKDSPVPVTTGNSLTAYATYRGLLTCMTAMNLAPDGAEIAIVGYPGSIALAVARMLLPSGCRLHLVHRRGGQSALDDIPNEYHRQIKLHTCIDSCYESVRLYVAASSSGGLIDPHRLMPGCVIMDTALPKDVLPGANSRRDILVIDGGLVSAISSVRFGAMVLGLDPRRGLNGCLAETIILSLEGRAEPFSLGRELPVDKVMEIGKIAERHGFFPEPLFSGGQIITQERLMDISSHHANRSCKRYSLDGFNREKARAEVFHCFGEHINPILLDFYRFNHVDRAFYHGEGCWLTDMDGTRYLDFVAGYGCLNMGHSHPKVIAALKVHLERKLPTFVQYLSAPVQSSLLAKRLSDLTGGRLGRVFLSNSGTEAIEAALKLAMAANDKPTILYCTNGYHGKTLGSLSVTGRAKHRTPFEPLLGRCEEIPFGDSDALELRISKGDICAFIMEPIQGEGGVILPPDGYLTKVRELCRDHDCVWILDEIQTGLGRTGKMFACEWENVYPDILVLAKSLSGGMIPIGATLSGIDLWQRAYGNIDDFALHTSTFGGGNFAATAALASLDIIQDEHLPDNARQVGTFLRSELEKLAEKYYFIRAVRGRGLMIAIEFHNDMTDGVNSLVRELASRLPINIPTTYRMLSGKVRTHLEHAIQELERNLEDMFVLRLMTKLSREHGILTFVTANNNRVMRIQPPLILSMQEARKFLAAFNAVCEDLSNFEV